jgi:hypothetical protein
MSTDLTALFSQMPNLVGLLIAIIVLKDELSKLRQDVSTKLDTVLEILKATGKG